MIHSLRRMRSRRRAPYSLQIDDVLLGSALSFAPSTAQTSIFSGWPPIRSNHDTDLQLSATPVGDVCGGDETSIANLIDIFVNLHHILRAGGLAADEDESPADRWAADDESLSDDDEVHVKHDGDGKDGGDDGGDDDDDDLDDDFEDQERRLSHRPLGRWAFTPPRGVPKGEVAGRHTAHRAAERASREPWGGGLVVPIEQYNDPVEVSKSASTCQSFVPIGHFMKPLAGSFPPWRCLRLTTHLVVPPLAVPRQGPLARRASRSLPTQSTWGGASPPNRRGSPGVEAHIRMAPLSLPRGPSTEGCGRQYQDSGSRVARETSRVYAADGMRHRRSTCSQQHHGVGVFPHSGHRGGG